MNLEDLTIVVCVNQRLGQQKSCAGSGSEQLANLIQEKLEENNLPVSVTKIKCFGRCDKGPVIRIAPGGKFFEAFGESDLDNLISHVHQLKDS
jgi:NADH:ubiquinone oxidoreductase subunit E